MTPKVTSELKVGDTIKVWWTPGRDTIVGLRPYTGPLLGELGGGTLIADFALSRTGMTLIAGERWDVIASENKSCARV